MFLSWGTFGRLLRRRLVLGLIFGLSLTYCAISLLTQHRMNTFKPSFEDEIDDNMLVDNEDIALDDIEDDGKTFQYTALVVPDERSDSTNIQTFTSSNDININIKNCRNSVQGKALIVDELGFVCTRQDVLSTGCCKNQRENVSTHDENILKLERYSCETCNPQGCCAIYEYCVSCCLHPTKRLFKKDHLGLPGRSDIQKIRKLEDIIKLRLRNLDRFQFCLAVCRTSSASVRHENTYKNPDSKHCYITLSGGTLYQNNNGDKSVVTSFYTAYLFILHKLSNSFSALTMIFLALQISFNKRFQNNSFFIKQCFILMIQNCAYV
ncbi:UPF0454 protein C12orf49 homolog isoform X2 [Chelonus insularis]|uniref:UPF0454 protein C12orf49 homolog isoform X1 n=1 Tax=Chelonus insularis TaxID=460826 RepID=UPI00158F361F|nr:UPF0454 protein C12orf49 homolog isoform X1 [Chelonus insularis]XP_034936708.1 UPF0454 protein C12orf49 homolog isoform X2 [Chelonus insularis]